jgi:hypothetical protein
MARKSKRPKRPRGRRSAPVTGSYRAQLKVRLPEVLRSELERAAVKTGWSMNQEIVSRLIASFREPGQTAKTIAVALLNELDDQVIAEMVGIYMQERAEDVRADEQQEDEQIAGEAEGEDK